jgi:hypothetical protein
MNDEISFSPWVNLANWNDLVSNEEEDKGGIYLFARFEREPHVDSANPLDKSVIYVGQSSKGTFKGRWNLFYEGLKNPTLVQANPKKYPRARRYIEYFGPDSSLQSLYVASLSYQNLGKVLLKIGKCSLFDIDPSIAEVDITNPDFHILDSLIKYIERRLILLYTLHHGYRPFLNED